MATARPPRDNALDRESAVELRASVLDAAISIGFRNSVMAKWMFDPNAETEEQQQHDSGYPEVRNTLFLVVKTSMLSAWCFFPLYFLIYSDAC